MNPGVSLNKNESWPMNQRGGVGDEAFATVFDASPAAMLVIDNATDLITAANRRFVEIWGRPHAALIGRSVRELELMPIERRERLMTEFRRTGHVRGAELTVRRADGATFTMLASTELLSIDGVSHRLAVFIDITTRKQIEARLATQHAVGSLLAEGYDLERPMPEVIESLCGVEQWDCGAVWLPTTEGALQCYGMWARPDLDASNLARVTRATVPVRNAGLLGRVLATGIPEKVTLDPIRGPHGAAAFGAGMRRATAFPILRGTQVLGVVALAVASDGSLEMTELGLFDSVGRMLGLFIERARAERSLRESEERLQQLNLDLERRVAERTAALAASNRDLEAFSASISHDLRAPLRAINGFSKILLEDFATELPIDALEHLESIASSGHRLSDLIDDLLEFARLGRAGMRPKTIDLDRFVREIAGEVVGARPVDLRIGVLGSCVADPSLLRQVWINLIDNAIKYSKGRDPLVIEIFRTAHGYAIRDYGVGFDMQYVDRLFGVFQRLHSSEDFEGTGVGLATVRRIVERHGGTIAARSELGAGSTFEFTVDNSAS
jgi:PAS domain S-box-containing protein